MGFPLLALSLFLQHPHDKKSLDFGVIGILCFSPDKALAGLVASKMVQIIFLFVSFLICKMGIISVKWGGGRWENTTLLMVIFEFTMTYLKSLMQCLAHSGCLINCSSYHNYLPPSSKDRWQTMRKEKFLPPLPVAALWALPAVSFTGHED